MPPARKGLWARIRAAAASFPWSTSSAFRGAEASRLRADRWLTTSHPDTEVQYSLQALRAASRDLVRNNPYAAGVVQSIADNVIGWEGIQARPRVTNPPNDPNGEPIDSVNWEIERGWEEWGEEYATVDGVESWFETQRLIAKSWVTDGEVFIRRHLGWDNPYAYAVELIDPDLLDENLNRPAGQGEPEIVMGVEVNAFGRPLAYHFWDRHPDDMVKRKRVRVSASEVTHFFVRYRTGQTRGFPLFASVLTTIEMLDGYSEAELVAARYHASKMLFFKNTNADAAAVHAARAATASQDAPTRRIKMAPGQTEYLDPGVEPVSIDPVHPNDAFDPFVSSLMRGVARGLGMSYLTLTGDVSVANYSSMRAGLLPERDHWKALQNVFARRVHRPVYRDFVRMGMLSGALELPGVRPAEFYACDWRGRRWQWVDPAKDLQGAEAEIHLGINSRERLASDRGYNFETIIDESAANQKYAAKAGVWIGGAGGEEQTKTATSLEADAPGAPPPPPKPAPNRNYMENGNGNGKNNGATNRLAPYTEVHGE